MKDNEYQHIGERFIEHYLKSGFGAFNKSELEQLVFFLLRQTDDYRNLDAYELAAKLRIPESRVRSLIIRSHLRFAPAVNHNDAIKVFLFRVFAPSSHPDVTPDYVEVRVDDPIERREVEYAVERLKRNLDYGRNRLLLRFRPIVLIELLRDYLPKGEDFFKQLVTSTLKDKKKEAAIFSTGVPKSEKASMFISELADKSGIVGTIASVAQIFTK